MKGTLGGNVVAGKRTICVHCHDLYRSHAINEVTKKKDTQIDRVDSLWCKKNKQQGILPISFKSHVKAPEYPTRRTIVEADAIDIKSDASHDFSGDRSTDCKADSCNISARDSTNNSRNTTTISNSTTEYSSIYNSAKHNEIRDSKFNGPVTARSNVHWHKGQKCKRQFVPQHLNSSQPPPTINK